MDDRFSAPGTYRVIYRIDDKARMVTVVRRELTAGTSIERERHLIRSRVAE